MALAPLKPCPAPGCRELVRGRGRCPVHDGARRGAERSRSAAKSKLYNSTWRRLAAAFRLRNPFCAACSREGVLEMSEVVDHIVPHKGDLKLFWDQENNWMALCKRHHDSKTATEDGGFGRVT
jgi:5-methylcytosine-specific restriction enzyme A